MEREYLLMNDIAIHHNDRMQNLKRYYPFFKLAEHTLLQYKDGRFADLDMGYIVLAVLRFFIEENHVHEKNVTYAMYETFMSEFLETEFFDVIKNSDTTGSESKTADSKILESKSSESESAQLKELIQYIFDKLCNDGRPFLYTYYDPIKKASVRARVKLLDSRFENNELVYYVTGDGIEFYLDTKEVKEESKITTEQLLLERLIKGSNYRAAVDVARRINGEVGRLMVRRDEVVQLMSRNIFEGMKAFEEFSKTGLAWFSQEQKLFAANRALIDEALQKKNQLTDDVYLLDVELKRAIRRHQELLSACTKLQLEADELIKKAKISRFRNVFSFEDFLNTAVEHDSAAVLEAFAKPLFGMNLHKSLNLYQLDGMLDYKPDEPEASEKVGEGLEEHYVYEDEKAQQRIDSNFDTFLKVLFEQLLAKGSFDLKYFNYICEMKFMDNILANGDYFSFIVHLSQKNSYDMAQIAEHQDTFLEGSMEQFLKRQNNTAFNKLKFQLEYSPDDLIELKFGAQISNIHFRTADADGGKHNGTQKS